MLKFKIGDIVTYKRAKFGMHKGDLEVILRPQPGIDGNEKYRVKQVGKNGFTFYLPEDAMEFAGQPSSNIEVSDIVIFPEALDAKKHTGYLTVLEVKRNPNAFNGVHVKQLKGKEFDFFVPMNALRLIKKGEKSMCDTTNKVETENGANVNPRAGKHYVEIKLREYFDTAEELDHYVKEHLPVSFETRTAVVKDGSYSHYNEEEESLITVTTGVEK